MVEKVTEWGAPFTFGRKKVISFAWAMAPSYRISWAAACICSSTHGIWF